MLDEDVEARVMLFLVSSWCGKDGKRGVWMLYPEGEGYGRDD
jgi:hypothetical protein